MLNESSDPKSKRTALPPLMQLTDAAAEHLRALYATARVGQLLRISLSTKGCSGLSYEMNWVEKLGPGDELVADKAVQIVIDRKATLFLIGTIMDYKEDALSSGFTFSNPNEKGRCGCGESFHV